MAPGTGNTEPARGFTAGGVGKPSTWCTLFWLKRAAKERSFSCSASNFISGRNNHNGPDRTHITSKSGRKGLGSDVVFSGYTTPSYSGETSCNTTSGGNCTNSNGPDNTGAATE